MVVNIGIMPCIFPLPITLVLPQTPIFEVSVSNIPLTALAIVVAIGIPQIPALLWWMIKRLDSTDLFVIVSRLVSMIIIGTLNNCDFTACGNPCQQKN
tara:strand:+ start:1075 stop:1368 length:294 start_codon:yes stop_codon:yes gene_type:complete